MPDGLPDREIFREEAILSHAAYRGEGDVLKISPSWTRWTYWSMVIVLVAGGAYTILGTVHEYASGPAIVRVEGKDDVTAKAPGTVQAIAVQPGQRVHAGDLLVELYSADETADLDRIDHELGLELVKMLRDPADQAARQSLIGLRTEKERAQAHLAERSVRAPVGGVVQDIRIRGGQHLVAGEPILSILGDDARFSVVAMLPGHYRPMLRVGTSLRLELTGYRYAYHELVIDEIGDEVVGPTEIRRYLGPELADTIPVDGPVVLVRTHLAASSFEIDGKTFQFFDGMQGLAEARVRTESILLTFLPGLKVVFGG